MNIDLDALRREAKGPGHEQVIVTRRYLRKLVDLVDRKADLDFDPFALAGSQAT